MFKVGDKVRCADDSRTSLLRHGSEYEVHGIDGKYVTVTAESGYPANMYAHRFELVEQPWQPKIGDRVRFTDECKEYWWFGPHTENKEGVVSLDRGADYDFDDGRFEVRTSDSFGIVGLKHIEPLPVAAEAQPLRIVEGRFYKTRDGRKVGPMRVYGGGGLDRSFVFGQVAAFTAPDLEDERVGGSYTSNGTWLTSSGHSPYDLISEWVDEPAVAPTVAPAQPTASNDNEAPAKFKVGDKVKANGGYTFDPNVGEVVSIEDLYINVKVDKDGYGGGIWAYAEEDLSTVAPQQPASTAGFTIPLVEDEPAAAKDGSTQLTVRITSDFTELHEQIDYAFERLKKLKKNARKLGIKLDFAKAA